MVRYVVCRTTAVAVVGFLALAAQKQVASAGPVPARLAGTWAATLSNYPELGLYAGRYRLRFGPGSAMHYIVPGEGAVPQAVSVTGNRITFMASGVCTTPGQYLWTVKGRMLTFTLVGDRCRKRVTQLRRPWTRVG